MSSTHIQSERERVVSVQTQSITARSSTRKGTKRNLGATWSHTEAYDINISVIIKPVIEKKEEIALCLAAFSNNFIC